MWEPLGKRAKELLARAIEYAMTHNYDSLKNWPVMFELDAPPHTGRESIQFGLDLDKGTYEIGEVKNG